MPTTCKHCQRTIVHTRDGWIDPEASGDDVVWRETCDQHDTFTAEHEPAPTPVLTPGVNGEEGYWSLDLRLCLAPDEPEQFAALLSTLGYVDAADEIMTAMGCVGEFNDGLLQHPGDTCPIHDPETGPFWEPTHYSRYDGSPVRYVSGDGGSCWTVENENGDQFEVAAIEWEPVMVWFVAENGTGETVYWADDEADAHRWISEVGSTIVAVSHNVQSKHRDA